MSSTTSIPVANRVHNFTYAIRNIVAEARAVERRGLKVDYLNIGDPIPFGFRDPAGAGRGRCQGDDRRRQQLRALSRHRPGARGGCHRVEPAWIPRRRRIACLITAGTSEGIELALTALANPGDGVLVPMPTYPLYTAVLAKIGAEAALLPHRPVTRLAPRCRPSREPDYPAHSGARADRSQQPDRRGLP